MKVARGIATPIIPVNSGGADAARLLGSEPVGFALDFLSNTSAVRT